MYPLLNQIVSLGIKTEAPPPAPHASRRVTQPPPPPHHRLLALLLVVRSFVCAPGPDRRHVVRFQHTRCHFGSFAGFSRHPEFEPVRRRAAVTPHLVAQTTMPLAPPTEH